MHRPPAEGNFCERHGEAKNLSLLQNIDGMWAMLTWGTEWLTASQLFREHRSGKKKIIFSLLICNHTD